MSRPWLLSLLCLAVLFLSLVQLTGARGELRVDETNSSILFEKDPAEVLLAVENPSTVAVNTIVQLELLDPQNKIIAQTTQPRSIAGGNQKLSLSLPFTFPSSNERQRNPALWYRLHYKISPQESPAEILAGGIVSLSEMTQDIFELHVAAAQVVREGNRYRVRVNATHPVSKRPVQNVRVDAQVTLEGNNDKVVKLNGSDFTDAKGRALFDFELPPRFPPFPHRIRPAGGELQVTGRKGPLVVQTKGDVLVDQFARVLITTDKPLYQPGQVMHLRALVLTPSRRAVPNHDTFFKICEPDGAILYRTVVTTSRFGVASADWTIPENARLGDYRIWVGVDGGDDETGQDVTISRYELPNFRVNVDPDRKFYLPGQDAKVTVRAEYLFGQPVLRGNVRVVREAEREWNYREQKWELREEDEQKGEIKAGGSFVANLNLKSAHEALAEDSYEHFRDITYAAYFTDPTTNRTEQRRFDVRVTKNPIHVYVIATYDWRQNRKLPLQFHVSTSYADGSPARSKVDVALTDDADDPDITKRVATVTTNRYGLAKVTTRLPDDFKDDDSLDVILSASDSNGRKGSGEENFYFDDDPHVRVETDKAIYRPGESINAVITTSGIEETLVVDLAGEEGLIRSERVQLRRGRAAITFPYNPGFKKGLSIVAYPESARSQDLVGTRTVLYPRNSELNIDVRSSKDTYRPGEDARLDLNVRSAGNRAEESALGVVVLDQAVVERFRTDREFGNKSYDYTIQRFLGLENQVAGISLRDLQHVDTTKPIPSDLNLLAAVLLRNFNNSLPAFYSSDEFEQDAAKVFGDSIKDQLKPLRKALSDQYAQTLKYPANETELHDSFTQLKIDFDSLRDPWGRRYRAHFSSEKQNDVLRIVSSGADKRDDTPDDFVVEQMNWPYFSPIGLTIDRAIARYHQRTGKFIRDAATLREEVSSESLNLEQLHDRWGKPYRLDFSVEESHFVLNVRSSGPDKQFSKHEPYLHDDFVIWKSAIDYFAKPRADIEAALNENLKRTKKFPQSEQELRQALRGLGDAFDNLRDPWGHPYYVSFKIQSVYADRVRTEQRAILGQTPTLQTQVEPVTRTLGFVMLRSSGPDAQAGSNDDFSVAMFSGIISEQARSAAAPVAVPTAVVFAETSGAIAGVVTDPIGAVVAGATVQAKQLPSAPITYEAATDDNGRYSFASLPPGSYEITFDAPGFTRLVITQVVVREHNITELNVNLEPGAVADTVSVTAAESPVERQWLSFSMTRNAAAGRSNVKVVTRSGSSQMSTPRLREYFPETLLWQPSVETDREGRARIDFKLADNITTWKMIVIGSTEDGRIGTTEKDIRAFQPFFVEHDPPRVLTEGDEISLPVVVRNYLSQPQKVDLEIKPESWFSLLGPAQKQTNVVAGDATRETFDFRVLASVKDGKQRITARGADENDAIEKPVTVHPDGEELPVTDGDVLDDVSSLDLEIPQTMIPNSSRGELKIYPNLMAHVVESVGAIMQRPYGCGEQTISSTYPSLLLLRHYQKSGEDFPLNARAQRYLKDGYSRLLNYRAASGGFTYWGNGEPDVALTAYALLFLVDAGAVLTVDQDVLQETFEWLVKQQRPDGSWRPAYLSDRDPEGPSVVLTAYVARVLARMDMEASGSLKRALNFLGQASQAIDEPHLLASYALAAIDAKDVERAQPVIEKLRTLALEEGNTTYWTLEINTPFYGWGLAGRVETTALVVQALARYCNLQTGRCDPGRKLINRGLLFLLKQKDRYGVWYSTQATINVLDAMLLLFSNNGSSNAGAQPATEIVVNGNRVQTVQMNDRLNNPITVDLSPVLRTGKNRIEIKRAKGLPVASVQAVANYYVPWSESKPAGAKTDLRLQVKFDKTEARINEEITCRVEVARVGFRGYGMMLAEIGIPPGAEVDRSSLQTALKDWTINQYDVLPDRVVVYLWPRAGGVSFNFKFRPRFGLKAKSAASTLYDYYNPEAAVVAPPALFTVR